MRKMKAILLVLFMMVSTVCQAESLNDVLAWYKYHKPTVEKQFISRLKSLDYRIEDISIAKSNFLFNDDGSGYIDCNYSFVADFRIGKEKCFADGFAFLKYGDNANNAHFFIIHVDQYDVQNRLYKLYEEEYETIVADYYKYLIKTYQ